MLQKSLIHCLILPVVALLFMTGESDTVPTEANTQTSSEGSQDAAVQDAAVEPEVILREVPEPEPSETLEALPPSTPVEIQAAEPVEPVVAQVHVQAAPCVNVSVSVQASLAVPGIAPPAARGHQVLGPSLGYAHAVIGQPDLLNRKLPNPIGGLNVEAELGRIMQSVDANVKGHRSTPGHEVLSLSCNSNGEVQAVSLSYVDPQTQGVVQFTAKGSRAEVGSKLQKLPLALQELLKNYLK